MKQQLCSRRHLLECAEFGLAGIADAMLLKRDGLLADENSLLKPPTLQPQVFAGVAASMAAKENVSVQQVNYAALRRKLISAGKKRWN